MEDNATKKRRNSNTISRFEMYEYAHKIIFFIALSKFVAAICLTGVLYVGFNYIVANDHSYENASKIVKAIALLDSVVEENDKLKTQLNSIDEKLRIIQSTVITEPVEEPKRRGK